MFFIEGQLIYKLDLVYRWEILCLSCLFYSSISSYNILKHLYIATSSNFACSLSGCTQGQLTSAIDFCKHFTLLEIVSEWKHPWRHMTINFIAIQLFPGSVDTYI
jgi:hypothetical protein